MKHKTRFNDDKTGEALQADFESLEIVIVPIFDGYRAMDATVKEWLNADFPGSLDGIDTPSSPDSVHVRVCSSRWWYYCWDTLRKENDEHEDNGNQLMNTLLQAENKKESRQSNADSYIHFQLVPIIKKTNHRKHNSHHWFFQGICVGLKASLVFLTDCGTTYHETCVARLVYALRTKRDLIGVTARQRVETPNPNFHPCEKTKISFLQGEHEGMGSHPCWKCHLAFYLSAAPLQGFEFEATLILNSALFNLVEAMPVLPGPCQLLDWTRMMKYRVVEEYFDLLFNEDTVVTGSNDVRKRPLPKGYRKSRSKLAISRDGSITSLSTADSKGAEDSIRNVINQNSIDDRSKMDSIVNPILGPKRDGSKLSPDEEDEEEIEELQLRSSVSAIPPQPSQPSTDIESNHQNGHGHPTPAPGAPIITFTEFLRVNMRLAEDRVLSFVTVFSTGFGTKWIPGATFYYEPEVTFQTLLTQRRRWINGTVASFMYFFSSKRARLRVSGGFFDSHKAGKSLRLVNALWALNLLQFIFVLISPSVFGVALFNGLKSSFDFGGPDAEFNAALSGTEFYLFVYVCWTINAYLVPGGKVPEWQCVLIVLCGFLAIFPVYYALIQSALDQIVTVHWIVMASMLGPVAIAISQSATSALLYLCYLPWFLSLAVFFLVYVPAYSFARLWDTTWGNRDTSRDDSIDVLREKTMKFNVMLFVIGLVLFNIALTLTLCVVLTVEAQLIFMVILFLPTSIQILGSVFFLLIVVPLRALNNRETPDISNISD